MGQMAGVHRRFWLSGRVLGHFRTIATPAGAQRGDFRPWQAMSAGTVGAVIATPAAVFWGAPVGKDAEMGEGLESAAAGTMREALEEGDVAAAAAAAREEAPRWAAVASRRALGWAGDDRRALEWSQAQELESEAASLVSGLAPLRGRLAPRRRRVRAWGSRLEMYAAGGAPGDVLNGAALMLGRAVEGLGVAADLLLVACVRRPPLDKLAEAREALVAPVGSRLASLLAGDPALAEVAVGAREALAVARSVEAAQAVAAVVVNADMGSADDVVRGCVERAVQCFAAAEDLWALVLEAASGAAPAGVTSMSQAAVA